MTLYLKVGRTDYFKDRSISYAGKELDTNHRTDIRAMLRVYF